MRQIIMPRGKGKTTKIIEEAYNCNGVIVVATKQQEYFVRKKIQEKYGLGVAKDMDVWVITEFTKLPSPHSIFGDRKIFIDEIDWCMNVLCGNNMGSFSLTIEN